MAKVYVLGDDGHDLSNAKEFGDILFVKEEGKYKVFSPSEVIVELKEQLRWFTGEDYLLISGSPFVMGLAMSMLFLSTMDKVNVLLFDAKKRQYFPRTITSNQLEI